MKRSGALYAVQRLRTHWDYLRTSFWFVPAVMGLAALGALWLSLAVEGRLVDLLGTEAPWPLYVGNRGDARDILSTVLSSMITMASLVFSITMVVLTLAASQFGPRLIRNFMASRQTQFVLGTFVMTIVYCLLALTIVARRSEDQSLPSVTVTVAIALAIVSVAFLVLHLHVLARSIVSETVIERVGKELDDLLAALPPLDPEKPDPPRRSDADLPEEGVALLGPETAGYVQAIEIGRLLEVARAADVQVQLRFRAGDYVLEGGHSIGVRPATRLDDRLAAQIRRSIVIGAHRTPTQDPDFAIRHQVEIAVRALSPGINDPYTAVSVLNRLSASLARLMRRKLPTGEYRDDDGRVRLLTPAPTYAGMLTAAFGQIRQNGGDKPVIVLYLLQAISRTAEHARIPEQWEALRRELEIVAAGARRRIDDPADRAAIADRIEEAERSIARCEAMRRS